MILIEQIHQLDITVYNITNNYYIKNLFKICAIGNLFRPKAYYQAINITKIKTVMNIDGVLW